MTRILVIEDERDLALGLRINLEVEGHDVTLAHTGRDGIVEARKASPDLIILDLMLPDTDGYSVLQTLRGEGIGVPVIILTARGEEVDKVRGFRAGADDYVTKPFGVMELLVRIQAILRRSGSRAAEASPPMLRLGDVDIDITTRTVRRDGRIVPLTPRALDLLMALAAKRGAVVSRHALLRDVWGYDSDVSTRTVDAHIAELRRKLESGDGEPLIITVWKTGYRLRED